MLKPFEVNSFPSSANFCRLLITFANSFGPDQDSSDSSRKQIFREIFLFNHKLYVVSTH